MQATTNLGLKKPETNEFVNISDLNENADMIDLAIGKMKPLDADITVYVSTTGSDTTGDGTSENPYETITYALRTVPKNLGDRTATINIADGTYAEDVTATGFYAGSIRIRSNVENSFNTNCVVQSFTVWTCSANITLQGLTVVEQTNKDAIYIVNTRMVNVNYVKCLKENPTTSCVMCVGSYVSINNCELLNHFRAVYATEGGNVFINGSRTTGNIVGLAGSIISNQNSSISGNIVVNPGGIQISSYGAKIGTLVNDVALYVATTGSDISGNGSVGNPFKTIQYALNTLPKDLGGYGVTIVVADGTYNESLYISGFKTGTLYIKSGHPGVLSSLTKITSIGCNNNSCYIAIDGFEITTVLTDGIVCNSCANILINSVRSVGIANTFSAIFATETNLFRVYHCELSNKKYAVRVINTKGYVQSSTGTGNEISIQSASASIIHLGGLRPDGTLQQVYGGVFFYENGTQISDIITSGLSCTWGTISGGYIRHGNLNGQAMITIQLFILTSVAVTAYTAYYVTGFPRVDTTNVAVTFAPQNAVSNCYLDGTTLYFMPNANIGSGAGFLLNATYKTNS